MYVCGCDHYIKLDTQPTRGDHKRLLALCNSRTSLFCFPPFSMLCISSNTKASAPLQSKYDFHQSGVACKVSVFPLHLTCALKSISAIGGSIIHKFGSVAALSRTFYQSLMFRENTSYSHLYVLAVTTAP